VSCAAIRVVVTFAAFLLPPLLNAADTLAEQIQSAQRAGHYAQAANLYLQLISAGTDTPEIRSNCGVMLHLAGKNREAIEQFRVALRKDPNLAGANLFAGLSEFDLGQLESALVYLKKAAELDPTKPAPLLALGKLYVAKRDYSRANGLYAKAADLDPNLAEAWYGVGVTDRSMAEEILNQAARVGTTNEQATKEKVQHLLDGAMQALTRAAELDPNSAHTHLLMAESLADAGKPVDAIPEYQAAMKLDPALDGAYLGLASEYWKQHQFDQALPLLKRVLVKSPNDPEANAMMADIVEHSGDYGTAQHYAETALRGNPDLIQTRVVLARIYLAKQEPKLAVSELRKVIAADPDGSYHFLLYRAYRQAGDERAAQEAMAQFQQLRYSSPKH
jgi:tetratricopeptide (TPR) repeat protein